MRITQEQYRSSGIRADRVHPSERGLPGESADFLPGKRETAEEKIGGRYLNDDSNCQSSVVLSPDLVHTIHI